METLGRGDINVGFDRRRKSESKFAADSRKNDDRPNSNRSHNQSYRHSGRGSRLPASTSSKDTTRSESLAPWFSSDNLSFASTISHRRQTTIGGKFGFVAFEEVLSDVISVCPQMTSWLNDSLDNVVCVSYDLESSKEKALPAFYYSATSSVGTSATAGSKSRPPTVSLRANSNKTDCNDSCPSQPRTPAGRRSKKLALGPDDKCFARSSSSLLVIYEPDF